MKHPVDIFKNVLEILMINSYQIQKDCKTKPLYQPLISNNFEKCDYNTNWIGNIYWNTNTELKLK